MKQRFVESGAGYYLLMAVVFFIFYSGVHPLMPFDTDDWGYAGYSRLPLPDTSEWNPTKVLPECLQPLVCLVAAYVVRPLVGGDILWAMVYTHAAVVGLVIGLYLFSLHNLLRSRFRLTNLCAFGVVLVFLLLHFLVRRISPTDNDYLLYGRDVNCYYNYVIPNLLAASLVLWLMHHDVREVKSNRGRAVLYTLTYLLLCSNLFSSVILVAYVGAVLTLDLFKKEGGGVKGYLRRNAFGLVVVAGWLVVQLFEVNGTRANSYSMKDLPFWPMVVYTFKHFTWTHFSRWAWIVTLLALAGAFVYSRLGEKRPLWQVSKSQGVVLLSLLFAWAYLILLCSRVMPSYIMGGKEMFGYVFFYLLAFALALGYLCQHVGQVKVCLPMLSVFIFFVMNTDKGNTFREILNWRGLSFDDCVTLDRMMIDQTRQAEAEGKDTVVIRVPNMNNSNNWPLATPEPYYIGTTFRRLGITRRTIVTVFETAEDVEKIHEPGALLGPPLVAEADSVAADSLNCDIH